MAGLSLEDRTWEDDDCAVPVDLEHVNKSTFLFIVRYLYGDVDEALFADCVQTELDEFLDLVLDVLAIANELMIDRLSQNLPESSWETW